jgi:hypothetical protein
MHKYYDKLTSIERIFGSQIDQKNSFFEFKPLFLSIENINTLLAIVEEAITNETQNNLISEDLKNRIVE